MEYYNTYQELVEKNREYTDRYKRENTTLETDHKPNGVLGWQLLVMLGLFSHSSSDQFIPVYITNSDNEQRFTLDPVVDTILSHVIAEEWATKVKIPPILYNNGVTHTILIDMAINKVRIDYSNRPDSNQVCTFISDLDYFILPDIMTDFGQIAIFRPKSHVVSYASRIYYTILHTAKTLLEKMEKTESLLMEIGNLIKS